jgi:hypothetical protein
MKRKWNQHQLMRGRSIGKATNCTTVTQTPHEYSMHTDGRKKAINCDPTSPCLENSMNDKNKSKNKHRFCRFIRHKQKEDTVCCSAVWRMRGDLWIVLLITSRSGFLRRFPGLNAVLSIHWHLACTFVIDKCTFHWHISRKISLE